MPIHRLPLEAIATVQGLWFLVTGWWPIIHWRSFQAITGPKTDRWLVHTVGLLLAGIGVSLMTAGLGSGITLPIELLALCSATALIAIDVVYVCRKRIRRVYLLDAALEALVILGWGVAHAAT